MGFAKFISLDEEAHQIWKERFGRYSQEFSGWICRKLKEEHLENMDSQSKRKHIAEKEKEINKEKEVIELEKKQLAEKIKEEDKIFVEQEQQKQEEKLREKESEKKIKDNNKSEEMMKISLITKMIIRFEYQEDFYECSSYKDFGNLIYGLAKLNSGLPTGQQENIVGITPILLFNKVDKIKKLLKESIQKPLITEKNKTLKESKLTEGDLKTVLGVEA